MSVRAYYGLVGQLSGTIDNSTVLIPVNNAISGALTASGFVNGTDTTYLSIRAAGLVELIKVVAVNGTMLTVERGQGGTTPNAFPVGSIVQYEVTVEAILEQIPAVGLPTFYGGGIVDVEYDAELNELYIYGTVPSLMSGPGIDILGQWPSYQINAVATEGNCCDCSGSGGGGGGSGAITEIVTNGTTMGSYRTGDTVYITQEELQLTGLFGIEVTGSWPSYEIAYTGGGSGGGSVESVAVGAGLVLTGSPTINPTISMANTGVIAGNYGNIVINARGQITSVPATLNPVSVVTAGTNIGVTRLGDAVTLNVPNAAVGVRGAIALADETDPFDPDDNENAATPAVVAAALASLQGATATGVSSFTAEVSTDYSNIIGATAQPLTLLAGEKALIMAEATMLNSTTPLTPVDFGIAVFNSTSMLQGNKRMTQSSQQLTFLINGPYNDTVGLATTAVPAGSTVTSYGLAVIKF